MEVTDADEVHTPNWVTKYSILHGNDAGFFSISTSARKDEGIIRTVKVTTASLSLSYRKHYLPCVCFLEELETISVQTVRITLCISQHLNANSQNHTMYLTTSQSKQSESHCVSYNISMQTVRITLCISQHLSPNSQNHTVYLTTSQSKQSE